MYVNKVNCTLDSQCQCWVTEVIDENDGLGKIKVQVVQKSREFLDEECSYVTEFEPGNGWCKVLVDG